MSAPGQEPTEPTEPTDDLSFEGDFDAERAKSLIKRLREENRTLKQGREPVQDEKTDRAMAALRRKIEELEPQAEQFRRLEEASKSETQRLQEAAENARREAEIARAEAVRYKAAAMHGVSADHFDLLGTGTEEEITARAEKLSQLLAAQQAASTPQPTAPPTRRPVEQLRPGATPSGAETEDDVIFARLFGPQK